MDITTFDNFLASQRESFSMFLKGCTELDREQMRIALHTHSSKMTISLTTEFPILGVGPSVSSINSMAPLDTARRSITSPLRSPSVNNIFGSPSPPGSNRAFKSPGQVPNIPLSTFKRGQSSTATPVTPNSKKGANSDHSSKASPFGTIRTTSGGVRSGIVRGGMTVGGAGKIFKPLPVTPKGKGKGKAYDTDDCDSSAGSSLSDDPYPKRFNKRTASAKKNMSPFEVAARNAERKQSLDSDSTSDFEIPLAKSKSIGTAKLRPSNGSSAKSEKKKMTPRKSSGGIINLENDDGYSVEREETPSKKQKTGGQN